MLRESSLVVEGALKISKTLKIPVLLSEIEMQRLLIELQPIQFYLIQGVCKKGEGVLSKEAFSEIYSNYISFLKKGELPPQHLFRAYFSSVISSTPDELYSISVDETSHIIKAKLPVIQLQTNRITYSKEDSTFRSQQFGEGGIEWGVQFSYPQLYQDPQTQDIEDVDSRFSNTKMFRTLQKWIRYNTLPTPFITEGKKINAPIRLGKECFSWIKSHKTLNEKGITIYGST